MNDYDDNPDQMPNPFQPNRIGRIIDAIIEIVRRVGHLVFLPFYFAADLLGHVGSVIAQTIEHGLGRLGAWLAECWWRMAGWLRLDALQRKVGDLQDTAIVSVGGMTDAVRERTAGSTWMRRLVEAAYTLSNFVSTLWIRFMEWAERSWFTQVVTAPLRWFVWTFYIVADFVMGWLWTREYRRLLFGIPAMLLIMPLAYCAVRLPFYTTTVKANQYRNAADAALASEDYESAELFFRKLAQLGDTHDRVILRSALLAVEQDRIEDAYLQMQKIAPLDEPGVPEAHLWIAQNIASGEIETRNAESDRLIQTHLQHARSRMTDDPQLNVWLARIHFANQRPDLCLELLRDIPIKDLNWRARVSAADMFARLNQFQLAKSAVDGAADHFRQQHEGGEEMAVDDYLSWAVVMELEGTMADAFDTLLLGLETYPESEPLQIAAQTIGLPLFDRYEGDTEEAWNRRLEILKQLLDVVTDRDEVLRRAAELTMLPPIADRANEILDQDRAAGELPAHVQETLGNAAIVQGRMGEARQHYQSALEQDPTLHQALNNLAYLTANEDPRDLQKALQLAEQAVKLRPENPHYLETRGQILIQLQQWERAAEDLALALNGMPYKREIHASMAKALHELGDHATAEFHEAQVEE